METNGESLLCVRLGKFHADLIVSVRGNHLFQG